MADSFAIRLMDKEPGMTSFRSLSSVKKENRGQKVGHAGTLDSFASGLMIVLIGGATKLTPIFSSFDKEYIAEITFGKETDTLDPEGTVIAEAPVPSREVLEAVIPSFMGKQKQIPPVYSAVHVDGKRAYREARSGKDIEMPELIRTSVSKGTYIRSLARDIAKRASSRGYLTALRRLRIGPWSLEDKEKSTDELLDMTGLFSVSVLNPSEKTRILNGNIRDNAVLSDTDSTRPYTKLMMDGELFGYGDRTSGRLRIMTRLI